MRHALLNAPILIKVNNVVRRIVRPDMAVERLFGLLRRDVCVLGVASELGGFVQHVQIHLQHVSWPRRSDRGGGRTHEVVDDNEVMLVQVVFPPKVGHMGFAHRRPTPDATDLCMMQKVSSSLGARGSVDC